MGQRNEAEVGGDTRNITLAGSMHYERTPASEHRSRMRRRLSLRYAAQGYSLPRRRLGV